MKCFSWVNTILGNLKNAITGTYRAFDVENTHTATLVSNNIVSTAASISPHYFLVWSLLRPIRASALSTGSA